ncbi:MAG TPA: histidine phosphatase family protein [Kofleriaceae bacterium]|jgi:probable phosphoglycerate mutase|nr:histidine phosphatase family protein [Kofleriaceae bacterium]
MADAAPSHTIYLCRHGDTAWSPVRRLAGRTDLPLTDVGELNARQIGHRLHGVAFDRVWVSPLARARRTAELAGYADRAVVDDRIIEMSFGSYEGQMVADIRRDRPGWAYLKDGCPGGESPDDLGRRVDSFLAGWHGLTGSSLIFAHSVILRVLTARYLGFPPGAGRHLMLKPSSISVLGYDPIDDAPAIVSWNDHAHATH